MTDMYNGVYQVQMNLVNAMKGVSLPEIANEQRVADVINKQLEPMQSLSAQISNIANTFMQSIPAYYLNVSDYSGINDGLVTLRENIIRFSSEICNLNTFCRAVIESFYNSMPRISVDNYIANIQEMLRNIPDSVYDTVLEDQDCTRQDIEEEVATLNDKNFSYSIEGKTPEEVQQEFWKELWRNHQKVAQVLFSLFFMLQMASPVVESSEFIKNIVLPATQSAIVFLQDKQDTYFVKVDSAKIYESPNSHSSVISNALYGDEVYQLEDVKLWVKIECKTGNGNTITGWIAKRNLMPYRDYEFNSDKLYEE